MKLYLIINKELKNDYWTTLESAKKDADEDEIIIECEVKELRRFKKSGWQEVKK